MAITTVSRTDVHRAVNQANRKRRGRPSLLCKADAAPRQHDDVVQRLEHQDVGNGRGTAEAKGRQDTDGNELVDSYIAGRRR